MISENVPVYDDSYDDDDDDGPNMLMHEDKNKTASIL